MISISVTVIDIIKNSGLTNFEIACGHKGIDRQVLKPGIIDYEFTIEGFMDEHDPFGYGDFLLSSLMFANGDEQVLYDCIKAMIEKNVSGLGIKNIFFDELPKSVIELCNREDFPVVLFDNSIFFEDIIADISNTVALSSWVCKMEDNIEKLLSKNLTRSDVKLITREMTIKSGNNILAYYLKPKKNIIKRDLDRTIEFYRSVSNKTENSFLYRYRDSYIALICHKSTEAKDFEVRFEALMIACAFTKSDFYISVSDLYSSTDELDNAIRECILSNYICRIMGKNHISYPNLGTWSIAVHSGDSEYAIRFMKKYLDPILQKSDAEGTLLKTAIEYIKSDGDIHHTSEKLYVHENTVRYRMNKIHNMLDSENNDMVFFQNLAMAVKLYLIQDYLNIL
ncbi:MAG: PucR family transcriptional regulator [Proteocatella sp.]